MSHGLCHDFRTTNDHPNFKLVFVRYSGLRSRSASNTTCAPKHFLIHATRGGKNNKAFAHNNTIEAINDRCLLLVQLITIQAILDCSIIACAMGPKHVGMACHRQPAATSLPVPKLHPPHSNDITTYVGHTGSTSRWGCSLFLGLLKGCTCPGKLMVHAVP